MKAVIQRVTHASVKVDGETVGSCGQGFLILLGVMAGDDEKEADKLVNKTVNLRIFEDENGKMNLSSLDIGGEMLVVSQFTLCADCTHGRRPSFTPSAPPDEANRLYEYFVRRLKENGISHVETGVFGADMKVELLNDGPVTIILDSSELK
uniref:D-aminoacyl-tRNA deacylase n=1 Tax=Eubacterium sp. TaxID=142586 RepID=UPI0040268ECF